MIIVFTLLEDKNTKEAMGLFDRIKKNFKNYINGVWNLHSEVIKWYGKDCMSNNNLVILCKHIKI